MNAPMAKATKDEAAACSGLPVRAGSNAQLLPGMGLEGQVGIAHHLDRQLVGHGGVDPPALVDGRQLPALVLGVVADGLSLDIELALHQFGLGPHRDVLPGGHGEGPGHQAGDAGQTDRARRGMGTGHSQDEGDVGDQAVTDTEDGGARSAPLHVPVTMVRGHSRERTEPLSVRTH